LRNLILTIFIVEKARSVVVVETRSVKKTHCSPSLTFFQQLNPLTVNVSDPDFLDGLLGNKLQGKQNAVFFSEYSSHG